MFNRQQKEWSKKLENCIEYETLCGCLLQFEASLIWNDEFEDNRSSPLIPSWRSIRENWRRTVRALADGTAKNAINSLPSVSDARSRSWNLSQDLELVAYIDYIIQTRGRRIKSLNVVDIGAAEDICLLEKFPSIASVPAEALRSRFAYIKLINHLISTILLPAADLSVLEPWSLGNLLVRSKNLMFLDTKLGILHQKIQPLISKENEPQTVILNRHEASKQGSSFENTLFCQLFQQLSLVDANYLRRKTQSWKVKFVGEEGHDVGGLYNASITDICTELMSDRLPLFVRSPNGAQNIGECREKFVPNSGATSNDHLAWFEFFGRLVGISCMSMGKTLSVELASVVWKWIVREALSLDDIKLMDYSCWRTIQILKYPEKEGIDAYNFEHYFEDVYFVVNRVNGEEHELILNGSSVELTWDNKDEYVRLLLEFKFNEFEKQLVAIGKGIASIVPYEFLALFSWRQLENVVCGSSVIDIELLKEKTVYHGGIRETDEHIGWFWEILSEFSPKDREAFLQFVWGRARLPSSRVGFGKDVFKISEHKATLQTSNLFKGTADQYLPVAHTCFFALELPRYSTKSVLLERLMYAIHNCKNIDGDTTHESQMNLNMAWSPED